MRVPRASIAVADIDSDESLLDVSVPRAVLSPGPTPPARVTRTAIIPAGRQTIYEPRRLNFLCLEAWDQYQLQRQASQLRELQQTHEDSYEDLSRFLEISETLIENLEEDIQPHQGERPELENTGERFS